MPEEVEVTVTDAPAPEYSPAQAHAEIMAALGGVATVAQSAYEEAKLAREIAEEARTTANRAEADVVANDTAEEMATLAVDAAIVATEAAADATEAAEEAEEASEDTSSDNGDGDGDGALTDDAPMESPPADMPVEDASPMRTHWLFRDLRRR